MKFNQLKLSSMALAIAVLVSSCGGGSSKEESSSDASSEFDAAKEQVAADVAKVLKDLPPPSEVPYLLMNAGAEFDQSIINAIDKVESYQNDEAKAALNLGVYATDIGYLSSYEKSELALEYMGQCQKLAAPVGVAEAIDYGMISRFESNMENKDSLATVINEVMQKSGERLSELDELNSAALLLAGSWIEGVYISTTIVNNYPDDLPEESRTLILEPLVKIVIDQKVSLNDLMDVMNDVPESEEVNKMKAELEKVKAIYDGELAEVEKQIAENTGGFVLKPSTLDNLAAEVGRIRASIVE
ncbi:hypothetical protein SAMN05421640_0293 [Ekhidna lutea]|uniref:Uncharacterized protein n=1 Tax=Ekhidna lutea TaxID=447679 RepID=A0A239ETX1_EKHLU|nr:hypothetical protein [Ekhidna lutea]SNS47304.1 hypothetical protein SAMN05421640_0293 [Ekhidna lutea]